MFAVDQNLEPSFPKNPHDAFALSEWVANMSMYLDVQFLYPKRSRYMPKSYKTGRGKGLNLM